MKRNLRIGVLLAALALFAGEANSPLVAGERIRTTSGRLLPVDAAPLSEQVLSYFIKEPRSLDVSIDNYGVQSTDIWLFERLVMLDSDDQVQPGAAQRWEFTPDGTTWTFYLRPGARWSDGRPVTAYDFEFTFKRFLDPQAGNVFAALLYPIKNARDYNHGRIRDPNQVGVRALDDLTLRIETDGPCPYLPYVLAYNSAAPVPPWQVKKYGVRWTEADKVVTNYSYRVAEWVPGRYLLYTPNPYYNGNYPGYLEKIYLKFFSGASAGTLPYENNEVDRQPVGTKDLVRLQQDEVLSRELHQSPHYRTWYLFFQTRKPPFNNRLVRQAISKAIDREVLCRVVLRGLAQPAYTMLPPHFPGYVGDKYRAIQQFNPVVARDLLTRAGYPGGKGFPVMECWIRDAISNPGIMEMAQAIQQMLKENLGIRIKLVNQELGLFMDNMYQQTIPMGIIRYQYDYPDPHNMLTQIWRSQPVGWGRHDWHNPRFDELVDLAGKTMDPKRRFALYDEAERILAEDAAAAFLFHDDRVELRKPWLKGLIPNHFGRNLFSGLHTNLMEIYIGNNVEKRVF